jgi:hypothetical protein
MLNRSEYNSSGTTMMLIKTLLIMTILITLVGDISYNAITYIRLNF